MRILLLDPVSSTYPVNLEALKSQFGRQIKNYNNTKGTSHELEFVLLSGRDKQQTSELRFFNFYDENLLEELEEFINENSINGIYMDCILTAKDVEQINSKGVVLGPESLAIQIHQKYAHRMPVGIEFNEATYEAFLDSEFFKYCSDDENIHRPFIYVSKGLSYPSDSEFNEFFNHYYMYLQKNNNLDEIKETSNTVNQKELKIRRQIDDDK